MYLRSYLLVYHIPETQIEAVGSMFLYSLVCMIFAKEFYFKLYSSTFYHSICKAFSLSEASPKISSQIIFHSLTLQNISEIVSLTLSIRNCNLENQTQLNSHLL